MIRFRMTGVKTDSVGKTEVVLDVRYVPLRTHEPLLVLLSAPDTSLWGQHQPVLLVLG